MRDIPGSAAAPAAKYRNCRRGRFMMQALPEQCSRLHISSAAVEAGGPFADRDLSNVTTPGVQSGLIPANLTTLPPLSVSAAISVPKSAGDAMIGVSPRSADLACRTPSG